MFLETPPADGTSYTLRNAANGTVVAAVVEAALTREVRNRGLLGRDHLAQGHALMLAPCWSVHTFFMRFPIDVIFVKRNGLVVKTRAAVPPWRLLVGLGAYATVELAAGALERTPVRAGDRLELSRNTA
jgi:uncharacterized protein